MAASLLGHSVHLPQLVAPALTVGWSFRRRVKAPVRNLLRLPLRVPILGPQIVRALVEDGAIRSRLTSELRSYQVTVAPDFDRNMPAEVRTIMGFEQCYWLFSSNELNYGLSQLRIDEAAHLFGLIRAMQHPVVVELGRYRGGTTFLFAAAGARVLSLDNNASGAQPTFDAALDRALARAGLRSRVELIMGDALTHPVPGDTFDLVLVHCNPTYEMARSLLERWWPGVRPGGYLVLHATPLLPGVGQLVREVRGGLDELGAAIEDSTPGENVFLRKL